MSLRSSSNIDAVLKDLDAWTQGIADVALPRALNKVADQAQVAGLRKVNAIYRVGPRTMEQYLSTRLAKQGNLVVEIAAKGQGFPLYLFQPRQLKGRLTRRKGGYRTGGGVSVLIKGRRVLIPHAFIATMKSGHRGVFARGAYGGKGKIVPTGETSSRFHFGKKRYSINELFTFGAPQAFSNPDVVDAMNDRAREQMPIVLAQEIRFASR